jgi:2-amino-4-hydroxy-6-hydroxymethyldihydropteridine diphosphokinase
MRAGIALGSNLGDRLANLKTARQKIQSLAQVEPPLLASAVYETEPVDCEPGAPAFLNAVMEISHAGEPLALLQRLRQIEAALGRPPRHVRNASRTIDLDLLYCDDVVMDTPELELPHPRMHQRRFVLEPLAEIRPDFVLPNQTRNVSELLRDLADTSPLVRFASEW